MSPTTRVTRAVWPPDHRFVRSAMASNTGCTSEGEDAITLRIAAVAVWRSRAMRNSFCRCAIPDLGFLDPRFADIDFFGLDDLSFEDLSLPTFSPITAPFEALGFNAIAFATAAVRPGAVARFADFRPRLAMFPPAGP